MSYTETIHWGAAAIATVAGILYAVTVWDASTLDEVTGALVAAMTVTVVAVVVFAVAVAVPMAIRSRGKLADERDDRAELGAAPYTFFVVVAGAVAAIIDLLARNAQDRVMDPIVTVNILVGSILAGLVTGSVVTLIRYRRGIR